MNSKLFYCKWHLGNVLFLAYESGFFLTGGQKQAVRLTRKLNKQTKRMKSEIIKYNARLSVLKEQFELPLQTVCFNDAKDPHSGIYKKSEKSLKTTENVPFSVKRRIIELRDLEERCSEELDMLKSEAQRLLDWRMTKIDELNARIEALLLEDNAVSMGLSAMLKSQVSQILNDVIRDKPVFEVFGIAIPISFSEPEILNLAEVAFNAFFEEKGDAEDNETEDSEHSDSDDSGSNTDDDFNGDIFGF